jgi:hypothetical protein
LPTLRQCRELFDAKVGQTNAWGDGWENENWVYELWNDGQTVGPGGRQPVWEDDD